MHKHLTRQIIALCLALLPVAVNAGQTTVDTTNGAQFSQPAGPEKKVMAETAKKTEYDKLPLTELMALVDAADLTAQFELASRYNYGRGLPKDTLTAMKWLRKAASAGQRDAMKLLAVKLYNGYDVKPNFKEAMKWAQKLAETGDIGSALMMGHMYATGESGKRDLPRAYTWYSIAAAGKLPEDAPGFDDVDAAQNSFAADGEMERDKTAGLLSAKQETNAQKRAGEWWMKHQDQIAKLRAERVATKAALKAAEEEAANPRKRKPPPPPVDPLNPAPAAPTPPTPAG